MDRGPAPTAPPRWPAPVQLLHWLGLVLIAATAVIGLLMVDMERGSDLRKLSYSLHKSLGMTALALGVLRLAVRLVVRAPAPVAGPAWQRRAAHATHALMYLVLLALPVSGWLLNSVAGQPLPWFGLLQLPALGGRNPELRQLVDSFHVGLFWTLAALVALHLAAVLQHQLLRRDGLLWRMLPRRRGR
ncbi:cytochrome b [Stenotrophomonas mori]|uniref:Cytochrome b n=1 Tax=Stenotrophomonas mori TaxID=2871096 RepID=A0ABT0SK75_9GAMM|nr:cytochrome b [Stenotrophomonas mori]